LCNRQRRKGRKNKKAKREYVWGAINRAQLEKKKERGKKKGGQKDVGRVERFKRGGGNRKEI